MLLFQSKSLVFTKYETIVVKGLVCGSSLILSMPLCKYKVSEWDVGVPTFVRIIKINVCFF